MKNEGTLDRIIRAVVGIALFYSGYAFLSGKLSVIAYVVGAIVFMTSLTGFCLLYKLAGIDTAEKQQ